MLLRNSGNEHQNNPPVSAQTVRRSSTYIILYDLYNTPATGWDTYTEYVVWRDQ